MQEICKLCLLPGESLVDSHIIPRAFYEDLRARKLKRIDPSGYPTVYSKGIFGKFLCPRCEEKFCDIDFNAINLIKKQKSWRHFHTENSQSTFVVENAVFNKEILHKFALSILWRAAASGRTEYAKLDLGKYYEEIRSFFYLSVVTEGLIQKTSMYFEDFRGGQVTNNQSFVAYRLHKKNDLFKNQYGDFHCHVFGFPYGKLFIRLGGSNPRQGFFDLKSDNFNARAVPWTSNLSEQYPNWYFNQAPREKTNATSDLIVPL